MTTHDNAPPREGWANPIRSSKPVALPPRCCGTFCHSLVCSVCGVYVDLALGSN